MISKYLSVLINALDLLGVNWEKFGIDINTFCDLFLKEVRPWYINSMVPLPFDPISFWSEGMSVVGLGRNMI